MGRRDQDKHRFDVAHTRRRVLSRDGILRIASAILLALSLTPAATANQDDLDFAELSLEDLMQVQVTSVSKKSEALFDAPAAICVIRNEDIQTSGHTTIPELLRLCPGIHVARINGNQWAISSRGLNERFTNKLLVLIDGRSVYTPLFGGVYWDVQDTLIDDIDRIEVIRGPGATVWGANAVNGVINIITKRAEDTQGGLVTAGGGDRERAFGGFRYGTPVGENGHLRGYAKFFKREPSITVDGDEAHDEWDQIRAGFRSDFTVTERDEITLQGDIYWGDTDSRASEFYLNGLSAELDALARTVFDRNDVSGGNVLGRWTHEVGEDSNVQIQAYYDRTERNSAFFDEDRDTLDFDLQHRFSPFAGHDVVWGAGYRMTRDSTKSRTVFGNQVIGIRDPHRSDHLYSAFIQDQIQVIEDRFWITLGTKLEHNSYTGWEFQPSGRFLAKPFDGHTFWGAVSRAVKTPTRADEDILFNFTSMLPTPAGFNIPLPPVQVFPGFFITPPPFVPNGIPVRVDLTGDRDFRSTVVYAYELGYRLQPKERWFFDLAIFFNDYRRLDRTAERAPVALAPGATAANFNGATLEITQTGLAMPPLAVRVLDAFLLGTRFDGQTYGAELAIGWQVTDWWELAAHYSFLNVNVSVDRSPLGVTSNGKALEVASPSHQFNLRSNIDLPWNLELGNSFYWVGRTDRAPSYLRADMRLGWKPCDDVELAIVGQNLFERSHPEWSRAQGLISTEVPRSFYGKVTFTFD